MIPQILKSILTVSIVSAAIGYIGFKATSKSFIEIFTISLIIQFIFFYFYNSIISYVTRLKLEKDNIEAIKLINTNNLIIDCGACKKVNNARIDLSTDNVFICEHCKTENYINITYDTVVKTKIYE